MSPRFFARAELFRNWLAKNHQTHRELLVGYYKQGSGRETMTWSASVDEALCFGWIDGMRKRIDESSYSIRFTPRKKTSVWSNINVAKVEVLLAAGRMLPAGLAAFEQRVDSRSGIYSYEQTTAEIDERYASHFKTHRAAWKFYLAQPASYRHSVNWWICSGKKEETRARRLQQLIECSADRQRIAKFRRT